MQVAVRPGTQQTQNTAHKPPKSFADKFEENCVDATQSSTSKEAEDERARQKQKLHSEIDDAIGGCSKQLGDAVRAKDSNKFWKVWAAAIENGFIKGLGIEGEDLKKQRTLYGQDWQIERKTL